MPGWKKQGFPPSEPRSLAHATTDPVKVTAPIATLGQISMQCTISAPMGVDSRVEDDAHEDRRKTDEGMQQRHSCVCRSSRPAEPSRRQSPAGHDRHEDHRPGRLPLDDGSARRKVAAMAMVMPTMP